MLTFFFSLLLVLKFLFLDRKMYGKKKVQMVQDIHSEKEVFLTAVSNFPL